VTLFREAAERKQKGNDAEKGDGLALTRRYTTDGLKDGRRSENPFSFRTDKTLTEALDALFFVTIV
jgi:hypothetical protein